MLLHFNLQRPNLLLQALILILLILQKPLCQPRFFADAFSRQDVHVADLVIRFLEVSDLQTANIDQSFYHIVAFAEADTEFVGDLALGEFGGFLQ